MAFAAGLRRHFDEAIDRVGAVELDYRIAERTVRLQFAGPALVPVVTAALAHLATEPSASPDIVLRVWDSRSTGLPLPPPPWSWDAYGPRGDIVGYNTATIRTAYYARVPALNVFDTTSDSALYWVPDAAGLPGNEVAAPLRILLHWWLESRGLQIVHGASVGNGAGGLLLAGEGGAGKSSTALACLQRGWSITGDDNCIVDVGPPPRAHSLYSSAKLHPTALERLDELVYTGELQPVDAGKKMLFLVSGYAEQVVHSLPIDAILLPHVLDQDGSALREATPRDALRALAPSTMQQLPGSGERAWRTLTKLAHLVPTYHLDLGRDASAIPDVMAGAFDRPRQLL